MLSREFGGGKVLKVLVICNNVHWSWRPFEVVLPNFEGFKDGQEFLVMYIIVQLCGIEGLGVERNQITWSSIKDTVDKVSART